MEKSKFDGKAIESLREVEHHKNRQERSRQSSFDPPGGHGNTNPSEEGERVP
jgi:hypothetical protein